ncbi:enoyl-CoA hydratase [Virgisporangium ochraceum]|uniref:Enoyl-CoA hydratase n=1 Tax=Virgisporangium ochraceum TaxID=65505 RepID=A0A8J3ZZ87_9ACTN|nr:enoyl-CoA hydratase-related protein [Virgisporangium ochraceum]GIJ70071.1 enoyl-CoA hydratase [Virgisporangium ochraceum]
MREIDTGTADFTARVEDRVAVLTMSRPERRNALSVAMLTAMSEVIPAVAADPEVRCVVLTGAGGAFCGGGDVKAFADGEGLGGTFEDRVREQQYAHRRVTLALYEMAKPTVALLPGPAAGAGLSFALACDLRYAVDTAVLTTAFARVGLPGDFGGSWLLTQIVGTARARELFYLSPRLDAAEALRLGLLTGVFPASDLEAGAMKVARELAAGPSAAYGYMKANLNRAVTQGLPDYLDAEAIAQIRCRDTADHLEAATAFAEKRAPRFS